jgi:hypothetical protein
LNALTEVHDLYVDPTPITDGSIWVTFQYRNIWVEAAWQNPETQTELLNAMIRGEVVDHDLLVVADAIVRGVPLIDCGVFAQWQSMLAEYPEALQARLIGDVVSAWMFPLHIEACWNTERGYRLKFAEHLLGDVQRVLRLVFALNRTWEPDWKRLRHRVASLAVKPVNLVPTINRIVSASSPREARVECYRLIMATLALVPPEYGASRVVEIIEANLMKHSRSLSLGDGSSVGKGK